MEHNQEMLEIEAGFGLSADSKEMKHHSYEIERQRKPTIFQVSALYSLAVILLIYIGFRMQENEAYTGLLLTELGFILIPSLILIFMYKYDFKKTLRLNRVGILNTLIVIGAMLSAFPVVSALNILNLVVIKTIFGRVAVPEVPLDGGTYGIILSLLIIACLPGICEEVMFRGVLLRGFERLGITKAILISSFLFGLLHLDFQKLLGTFLLGALIGLIVYRTNSIFAGMIAHFSNNAIAVLLYYAMAELQERIKPAIAVGNEDADKYISSLTNMPTIQLATVITFYGFLILGFAAALVALMYALIKNTSKKVEQVNVEARTIKKAGFAILIPGLFLIISTYTLEGLTLIGEKGWFVDGIAKLLLLR
jgi:membrane protease YdiL (CAAX protease family)